MSEAHEAPLDAYHQLEAPESRFSVPGWSECGLADSVLG